LSEREQIEINFNLAGEVGIGIVGFNVPLDTFISRTLSHKPHPQKDPKGAF